MRFKCSCSIILSSSWLMWEKYSRNWRKSEIYRKYNEITILIGVWRLGKEITINFVKVTLILEFILILLRWQIDMVALLLIFLVSSLINIIAILIFFIFVRDIIIRAFNCIVTTLWNLFALKTTYHHGLTSISEREAVEIA